MFSQYQTMYKNITTTLNFSVANAAMHFFQLEVKTNKNPEGEYKYTLNGKEQIGTIMVKGSPNSYVMTQMVDHAVLVLNDKTTLTPERVSIAFSM